MAGVQPPRGYLATAALTFGGGVRVILRYPDSVPPVLADEIITQSSPGARGPWAYGKGAGAPF